MKCFSKWCTCTIFYRVKYLGVWTYTSLKDDDDIQRLVKSLQYTVQQTNSTDTFNQCSSALKKYSISCLLHAPIYACQMWRIYTRPV